MTTTSAAPALLSWGFSGWVGATRRSGDFVMPPELDGVNDAVISINGRKMINFAGIGILGWQHDSEVRRVFAETAATYGLVVGGSRLVQGVSRPHQELEALVARITGREKALTFATGLLANVGFVNAMTARFSFDDRASVDNTDAVLVLDRHVHWSVWKGTQGLERGRNLFAFRHNDVAHLRELLETLRGRRVLVGFETVYSADGTIAPIREIVELCEEFGAISFADDANGFMVYGNGGHRFADEYEALRRVTFLMVSFGKGVGLSGGALAGPADALDAFHYMAGTSLFTTNIQPPTAGAIVHVLRRMTQEPSIMERYLDRVDALRARLTSIGCVINPTPTYITSIPIPTRDIALRVRTGFLDRGFLVPMFGYPAVKKDLGVIRLMMNDRLADEHLDAFVDTLAEFKRTYGF